MEKPLSTSSSDQSTEICRTIKLAVKFLTPLVLIIAVLNIFVMQWDPSPHYAATYREMYEAAPDGAPAIIMGGSNGKFGVNPKPLEVCMGKTLNLCLNGCGPLVYRDWFENLYLRNCPPPDTMVLVLNEYVFDPRLLVRKIEHDAGHLKWKDYLYFIGSAENELSTLLYNRLALTRRRAALWHTWFGTPIDEHVDMSQWYHGWAPVNAEVPFARSPKEFKVKSDSVRKQALRAFIVSLKDSGIRVIVVNPPICIPSINITNQASPELQALTSELGVEYLDYNGSRVSDLNYDQSQFMDWEHLNAGGAQRWSETLARDICESKKTRQSNERQSNW